MAGDSRGAAPRLLLTSVSIVLAITTAAVTAVTAAAQTQPAQQTNGATKLNPIRVEAPKKRPRPATGLGGQAPAAAPASPAVPSGDRPGQDGGAGAGGAATPTPLNGNAVAGSASLLGLPIREIPASVNVVSRQQINEQGYRTTTETAQGAVGVLSGDAAGAPAGFSMRGFSFGEVNVLYNGISTGPQSITSRWMDTASLYQVEFLKGPSSLMSGLDAIGGSVNYVTRQPTSGAIRNEIYLSLDTFGSVRTHFGSGGSTTLPGLDYRFDVVGSRFNSFIDGDYRDLASVSGQLNYRVSDWFKVFGAVEYKQDSGHAYWGTPLVPVSFAGPFAINGVVQGTAVNTFNGTILGPLTVDSRTLTTNYNVADNSTGARELWLRTGFEWSSIDGFTMKDQAFYYQARRHWIDSETYAFNPATSLIERDRFFVTHDQHIIGNNLDLLWNSQPFGLDNKFAMRFQTSSNWITFTQEGNPDAYPFDSGDNGVTVINPIQGLYGQMFPDVRNIRLDTVAAAVEDRIKLTSAFALIGGVRLDNFTLTKDGANFNGTIPDGLPFTQLWNPVAYRAAYTYEPIQGITFYSMYATAYDPAAAGIFSVSPANSLALTSARIYETGVKGLSWDKRLEWTLAAYNIDRQNVYVQTSDTTFSLAGEVVSKGIEASAAARPIDGLKLWGNVAFTQARYENFNFAGGSWTGNTPSNVAPVIVNAGGSYRFESWRCPLEIGGSVRHVGNRYVFEDDNTTMLAYTTAELYAFVDIRGIYFDRPDIENLRLGTRIRNLTNAVYAGWSDPGYPDQVYLGAPRTFEVFASARW
jgi:iron complex outermembrane recepter protein